MENASYTWVDLHHVGWEEHQFAIQSFVSSCHLENSLRRTGILSPPLVLNKGHGRFVIVDGFKRLQWARANGVERVECLVFPENSSPVQLMLFRLEGKLCGPPLNVAEKAQIIAGLAQCLPLDRVAGEYLPDLHLPPRPDMVQWWCRLADAGHRLLTAAAAGEICERAALELTQWDDQAKEKAVRILQDLRCSASIQMEILERVTEIARRGTKSRLDVLNDDRLHGILTNRDGNRRQNTQAARELLRQLRFPRLWKREERFFEDLRAAGLSGNFHLVPPPCFEGEQWQLHLKFSNPRELQELAGGVRNLAQSTTLRKIMEVERDSG